MRTYDLDQLREFVRESERIEGIHREPRRAQVRAHEHFLGLGEPDLQDLCNVALSLEPRARLREQPAMNVRIANHRPPSGGPEIPSHAEFLVRQVVLNRGTPYRLHIEYETLHPFMDGNGRTGRLLWAWQMIHHDISPGIDLGFLHAWYYQGLDFGRA
ncbi:MAG: Fic family protein [Nitrospiraceae bacterium]